MKSKNSVPSPAGPSPEKLKRPSWFVLASSGAFLLLLVPLFASASVFSIPNFLAGLTKQTEAAGSQQNSQTLSLLTPARNIDPSPAVGGGDITLVEGQALLSEEGLSGTTADVDTAPPEATAISVYTVHKGDTLAGIAKMFDVTANTIVWANNLKGGIHEGDQLVILPITGVRYTVVSGDTLPSIAKKFKADANEIAQYNNLNLTDSLASGDTIIVPNGEVAPTAGQIAQSAHAKAIRSIARGTRTESYLGGSGPDLGSYFSWPVDGGILTQGLHGWNAIDIGAPRGTDILAAAGGVVIVARGGGGWNGGYGNYVVISHPNGTQTLYAHMSRVLTSAGASVSQGDIIGRVGATGEATGSHLHFEVRGATNPFAGGQP